MRLMNKVGFAVAVLGAFVACAKDDEPRAPADAIPEATSPISGTVTLGTVGTRGRATLSVRSVKLTRTPVTVREYRQCVESGFCSVPSRSDSACDTPGIDGNSYTNQPGKRESVPVTCTTSEQAARYCRWVGGRMPRIDEWELAARGSDVHRYPWGDATPSCEHIMRLQYRNMDPGLACGGSPFGDDMSVGKHPAGRGAGVLDDVLVTRGEYVLGVSSPTGGSCSDGTTCVIRGGTPGAIEGVTASGSDADLEAAGFRCAWSAP